MNGDDPRPVDPRTGAGREPLAQPGYYPGFHSLDQRRFWDRATRDAVLERLYEVAAPRFFSAEQLEVLAAVCARLLPQDDRDAEHRIALAPQIDRRLADEKSDGYRYENMPPDGEAYVLGLSAIGEMSVAMFGRPFAQIALRDQDALLRSLHDGTPLADHDAWHVMPVDRFFALILGDCAEMYYSHPWAWDEIGFGGPSYPRGYMRLEHGEPEPWEVRETRYDWEAPAWSASAEAVPPADEAQYGSPGQGGTH